MSDLTPMNRNEKTKISPLTRKEALIMGENIQPLSRAEAFLKGTDIPAMYRKEQAMADRSEGGVTPEPEPPLHRTCKVQVKNDINQKVGIKVFIPVLDPEFDGGYIYFESELKDRGVTEITVPIPYKYSYDWGGPNWNVRYPLLIEYSQVHSYYTPSLDNSESHVDYGGGSKLVSLIKTYGNNNYLIAPVQDTASVYLEFNYEEPTTY